MLRYRQKFSYFSGALLSLFLMICLAAPGTSIHLQKERVSKHHLGNGLTIIVAEQPNSGKAAVCVTYRAGSAYEPQHRGGIAHLVEHLTSQGTDSIGSLDWAKERPLLQRIRALSARLEAERSRGEAANSDELIRLHGELMQLLNRARATSQFKALDQAYQQCSAGFRGGSTARDFVQYYAMLPQQSLTCALRIEAERMQRVVMRSFYQEREEVLQEMRQHTHDSRIILLERTLSAIKAEHPYSKSNWGSERQVASLSVGEVSDFYQRFYCPQNTVLCVVGDVRPDAVFALAETYFGKLRPGQYAEPLPAFERVRNTEVEIKANESWFMLGWVWPPRKNSNLAVLYVLSRLLQQRLQENLVHDAGAASAVDVEEFAAGGTAGGLTTLIVKPTAKSRFDEIERKVAAELERIREEQVNDTELLSATQSLINKLKHIKADYVVWARELAAFEIQTGRGEAFDDFGRELNSLTAREVREAAQKYLRSELLVKTIMRPKGDDQ